MSNVYKTLDSLKNRLNKNNELVVNLFDDFSFVAKFNFNKPASVKAINDFLYRNDLSIPDDYRDFLLLNNGAELFKGQYEAPIKLYSLEEIQFAIENHQYPKGFFPIGYYPDTGPIMIDIRKVPYFKCNYLWILATDLINLKCNFQTWLNRIIVSQGMSYWEWSSETVTLDSI